MSDEFTESEAPVEEELTLDTLFNRHVDHEQLKAAERSLALSQGNYNTDPDGFKVVVKKNEKINREYAMCSTAVSRTDENGKELKGKINYFLSWDPRNSTIWVDGVNTGEDSGKADSMTKLYIQAEKAYFKALGDEAKTEPSPGDVISFLSNFTHRLYITLNQNTAENRVSSISAAPTA